MPNAADDLVHIITDDGTGFLLPASRFERACKYYHKFVAEYPPFKTPEPHNVIDTCYIKDTDSDGLALILSQLNGDGDASWLIDENENAKVELETVVAAIEISLRLDIRFVAGLNKVLAKYTHIFPSPFFRTFVSVLIGDGDATRQYAWTTVPHDIRAMHPILRKMWEVYVPTALEEMLFLHRQYHRASVNLLHALSKRPMFKHESFPETCRKKECAHFVRCGGNFELLRSEGAARAFAYVFSPGVSSEIGYDRLYLHVGTWGWSVQHCECQRKLSRSFYHLVSVRYGAKLALLKSDLFRRTYFHFRESSTPLNADPRTTRVDGVEGLPGEALALADERGRGKLRGQEGARSLVSLCTAAPKIANSRITNQFVSHKKSYVCIYDQPLAVDRHPHHIKSAAPFLVDAFGTDFSTHSPSSLVAGVAPIVACARLRFFVTTCSPSSSTSNDNTPLRFFLSFFPRFALSSSFRVWKTGRKVARSAGVSSFTGNGSEPTGLTTFASTSSSSLSESASKIALKMSKLGFTYVNVSLPCVESSAIPTSAMLFGLESVAPFATSSSLCTNESSHAASLGTASTGSAAFSTFSPLDGSPSGCGFGTPHRLHSSFSGYHNFVDRVNCPYIPFAAASSFALLCLTSTTASPFGLAISAFAFSASYMCRPALGCFKSVAASELDPEVNRLDMAKLIGLKIRADAAKSSSSLLISSTDPVRRMGFGVVVLYVCEDRYER